jgi:hypothetical protein
MSDIQGAFKPDSRGLIYFSVTAEHAETYAKDRGQITEGSGAAVSRSIEAPSVVPVYLKTGKRFDGVSDWMIVEEMLESGEISLIASRVNLYGEAQVKEDLLDAVRERGWLTMERYPGLIEALKNRGYDSIYLTENENDFVAVLDPSQIRSINAAFDPDYFDSSNMLARRIKAEPEKGTPDYFSHLFRNDGAVWVFDEIIDKDPNVPRGSAAPVIDQSDPRIVRAKKDGFNTDLVWFNGTNETGIEEFDGSKSKNERIISSRWSKNIAGNFTLSAPYANQFAEWASIADEMETGKEGTYGVVYPVLLKTDNLFDIYKKSHREMVGITQNQKWTNTTLERKSSRIKKAGFDGYYDFDNDSSEGPIQQINVAIFDPKNIRSIHAQFMDPSSSNMLARRGEAINYDNLLDPKDPSNLVDPKLVRSPVDLSATPEVRAQQLHDLGQENARLVKPILRAIDKKFKSKSLPFTDNNFKKIENIISKSTRPSVLARKPWFGVEHIRDGFRFKTVVPSYNDVDQMVQMFLDEGVVIVKAENMVMEPKEWGFRIIAFDLMMPNGQIVEWYLPLTEVEAYKNAGGHEIFEKWRNRDLTQLDETEREAMQTDIMKSYENYFAAFDEAVQRVGEPLGLNRGDVIDQVESAWRASLDNAMASAISETNLQLLSNSPMVNGTLDQAPATRMADRSPSTTAQSPSSQVNAIGLDDPSGLSGLTIDSTSTLSIPQKDAQRVGPAGDLSASSIAQMRLQRGGPLFRRGDGADPYANMSGRELEYQVRVESTGDVATLTVDAATAMRELDARVEALEELRRCI